MSYAQAKVANGSLVSLRLSATTETTVDAAHANTATTAHGATTATTAHGAVAATDTAHAATETHAEVAEDPSPLQIEPKELIPGLVSFLVLLALLRYVFYPKVHGAMQARSAHIAKTLADSDGIRDAAHKEVADYQADLAKVRTEAAARVDAARATVESERSVKMAEVNARLATKRSEAAAAAEVAKAGVSGQVASAAGDVASQVASMVLGRTPDAAVVSAAVANVMGGAK